MEMLRVFSAASGDELALLEASELPNVHALKQELALKLQKLGTSCELQLANHLDSLVLRCFLATEMPCDRGNTQGSNCASSGKVRPKS